MQPKHLQQTRIIGKHLQKIFYQFGDVNFANCLEYANLNAVENNGIKTAFGFSLPRFAAMCVWIYKANEELYPHERQDFNP